MTKFENLYHVLDKFDKECEKNKYNAVCEFLKTFPLKEGDICEFTQFNGWHEGSKPMDVEKYIPIKIISFEWDGKNRSLKIKKYQTINKKTGKLGVVQELNNGRNLGAWYGDIIKNGIKYPVFNLLSINTDKIWECEKVTLQMQREKYPKILEIFGNV